jgi:hypothetical protein
MKFRFGQYSVVPQEESPRLAIEERSWYRYYGLGEESLLYILREYVFVHERIRWEYFVSLRAVCP